MGGVQEPRAAPAGSPAQAAAPAARACTFSNERGAPAAMAVECSRSVMTKASSRSARSSSSWRPSASPTCGWRGGRQAGRAGGKSGRKDGEPREASWLSLPAHAAPPPPAAPATAPHPPTTHLLHQALHQVFEVLHLAALQLARRLVPPVALPHEPVGDQCHQGRGRAHKHGHQDDHLGHRHGARGAAGAHNRDGRRVPGAHAAADGWVGKP